MTSGINLQSHEAHRLAARVVGQMSLAIITGRASRALLRAWADTLREAAAILERMAER